DLLQRDVRVEADAAFARAAHDRMLDAVAGEDAEGAVVHLDRQVDDRGAPEILDDVDDAGVELVRLGGFTELREVVFDWVQLLLDQRAFVHRSLRGQPPARGSEDGPKSLAIRPKDAVRPCR